MAGIAGLVISGKEEDPEFLLQKMSEAIRHRRIESYHTFNQGHSRCLIVGPRSFQGTDDEVIILDTNRDLDFIENPSDVTSITGIFAAVAVIIGDRGVSLIRTLDGTRPMYYGISQNKFAFASERKSLWNIKILSARTLEPGQGLTYSWEGELVVENFAALEKPIKTEETQERILNRLKESLETSFERLRKKTYCAILFSGGVDSSLVAHLASKRCENAILISTRAEQARDKTAAVKASEMLGLPLFEVELNSKIIWENLPKLIYAIETSRQMDVEIALPFHLAAQRAEQEGCSTVISGQGPDELFGGYARHVKLYVEKGPEFLMEQLWNDVRITHEANIERDERAIAAHGVDSFFPYLDQEFARFALSIPAELKVNPDGKPQRKVIFRELAKKVQGRRPA